MIAAPPAKLWELISDPHHLPRWWPRVERVEDVAGGAFTELMRTAKGKAVRADFDVVRADQQTCTVTWAQRVQGTPFGRVLASSETQVTLAGSGAPDPFSQSGQALAGEQRTEVTIEMRQRLIGVFPRLGGRMVKRAAAATIEEALDGLERMYG